MSKDLGRCIALNDQLRRCGRPAVRVVVYHGDNELHGYFNKRTTTCVRAALCDVHSKPEPKSEAKGRRHA